MIYCASGGLRFLLFIYGEGWAEETGYFYTPLLIFL